MNVFKMIEKYFSSIPFSEYDADEIVDILNAGSFVNYKVRAEQQRHSGVMSTNTTMMMMEGGEEGEGEEEEQQENVVTGEFNNIVQQVPTTSVEAEVTNEKDGGETSDSEAEGY
jgi:hypothetical protein